jgi:hypothetical protein
LPAHSIALLLFIAVTIVYGQKPFSPEQFLSFPIGTYFSWHHQVVDYFKQLEKNAPTALKITSYRKRMENREQLFAFISTKENLKNLDKLRLQLI